MSFFHIVMFCFLPLHKDLRRPSSCKTQIRFSRSHTHDTTHDMTTDKRSRVATARLGHTSFSMERSPLTSLYRSVSGPRMSWQTYTKGVLSVRL